MEAIARTTTSSNCSTAGRWSGGLAIGLLLLLAVPSAGLRAQFRPDPATATVDTIIVQGNKTTERFVILSEIALDVGAVADSAAMARDKRRLESLGIFSHASLQLRRLPDDRTALVVDVTELWYIWPGIFVVLDEKRPTERYGLGFMISHDNFRGRRETLALDGRLGFVHGFQFRWKIPYLFQQSPQWSLETRARYYVEEEPLTLPNRKGIEQEQYSLQAQISRRFTLREEAWLLAKAYSVAFRDLEGNPLDTIALISSSGNRDLNLTLTGGAERNTYLYKPWPENGYRIRGSLAGSLLADRPKLATLTPHLLLAGVVSPLERLMIAGMASGTVNIGHTPRYSQLLISKDFGVRTATDCQLGGSWRALGSLELRGDIIPLTYLSFDSPTLIQRYTRKLKFGLSAYLFADIGAVGGLDEMMTRDGLVENPGGWAAGYGAALAIHVPYNDLLRLEVIRSARFPDAGLLYRFVIGPHF